MIVYRVEDKLGKGIYQGFSPEHGRTYAEMLTKKVPRFHLYNENARPCPTNFYNLQNYEAYFFGFPDEKALHRWFPKYVCGYFHELGLHIYLYKVKDQYVESFNGKQVAFIKAKAKKIGEYYDF